MNDIFSTENDGQSCQMAVSRSAVISECGNYRYSLERVWDKTKPRVMFLMLNPSTADALVDDATIRRCISFAKSWGYGSFCVGNLFAYRSTDPKELLKVNNPVGFLNQFHLDFMKNESEIVVCAWGNSNILNRYGKINKIDYQPILGWKDLHYIDLSKDGTPKHPLYLKSELMPKKYEVVSARVLV